MSSADPPTPRTRLTSDAVLTAAVELADEIGVAPLTIRRLAAKLGVKPMSLYHHVAGKDHIFDGIVDRVFSEIALPPTDRGWKEAMRVRALSAREVLARHPWAAPMMESRVNAGPATLRHHDAVLGCLRGAGFSLAAVAHAYALIDAVVYGFALQEAGLPFDTPEEAAEVATAMAESFPAGAYPHMAAFMAGHVLCPGYDFAEEFTFGLDLVLDGLDERLARAEG
jgi:AcrR family transcriptional regulator